MQLLSRTKTSAARASCARDVLDALPPVMWFIRRNMRSFRRGLSVPQFRALVFIELHPRASLSAVAEHLDSSLPTTSRVIGGLVRHKLVTRVDCPDDRRQCALSLTARGHTVLNTAWDGTERELTTVLRKMPASDQQIVRTAMKSLTTIFGSLHGSAPDLSTDRKLNAKQNGKLNGNGRH